MPLEYQPPLDKLFQLGETWNQEPWHDYRALGLGPEHVPDLIRLATDTDVWESELPEAATWAPIHAWLALAQLQAVEAAAPLAGLLREIDEQDSDAAGEILPVVFGVLGPAVMPVLTAYLADTTHGLYARVAAAHSLEEIAKRHPQARAAIVAALTEQLSRHADQDRGLNGFLVAYLVELEALEAAPLIEAAFAAGHVDEDILGDWEDAQVALGLKPRGSRTRRAFSTALEETRALLEALDRTSAPQERRLTNFERRMAQQAAKVDVEAKAKPKRKRHRKKK